MESNSINMINSKDQQKNPEKEESSQESDLENRNRESKIELSDNHCTKFLKADPKTKPHNTQSVNHRENNYQEDCDVQTKHHSLPDSVLLKTKTVEDLDKTSPNIKNSQTEINKDRDSISPKSTRSENLCDVSTESSEQGQPKKVSDNGSLSNAGSRQSLGTGSPRQQNQTNDDTDTYSSISSGSFESFRNGFTDNSENSEQGEPKVSDNGSLSNAGSRQSLGTGSSRQQNQANDDTNTYSSISSGSFESLRNALTENSEQSQPKEVSDNGSLSDVGSRQSSGTGSSRQQNQANDDTYTCSSISSGSFESFRNALTDVSENSERNQLKEISDSDSLSDEGNGSATESPSDRNLVNDDTDTSSSTEDNCRLHTNSTDFGDISEATSDSVDTILRMQRKKKKRQKAVSESESESLEDSPVLKSNIFFPVQSESSREETETTTTDDLRLTPFENMQISSWPSNKSPTFSEDQNSTNSETPDYVSIPDNLENSNTSNDRLLVNKLHYSEASDDQLSLNKCDNAKRPEKFTMNKSKSFKNSETPRNQSINDSFGICEKLVKEPTKNKSNRPEMSDDESLMDISDNLKISESNGDERHNSESELEMDLGELEVKSTKSQKRKLSTINEEAEESENNVKQVRLSD